MRTMIGAVLVGALSFGGPASAQVATLDLDRFDGRWFEIMRSPNDLQKDCRRTQIDFTPQAPPTRYGVLVTCTRRADGGVETLRANARVTGTRFRMSLTGLLSFGGLAGQTYQVMDHAADYDWAILALPNKSDWWVWHRNQAASDAERAAIMARVRALGLPASPVVQTNGR